MNVLIDLEQMCVRYKHPAQKVLTDLMHIEYPHCSAGVFGVDHSNFIMLSDMELRILYKNLSGQQYQGLGRDVLLENVILLLRSLPDNNLNGFEISTQASSIDRYGERRRSPTDAVGWREFPVAVRRREPCSPQHNNRVTLAQLIDLKVLGREQLGSGERLHSADDLA